MVEKKKICPIYLISYRVKLVSAVCPGHSKAKVRHASPWIQPAYALSVENMNRGQTF